MIQLSFAGYSAHGLGVRVWVSLALFLVDTVHLAAALATAFAFGLSFTRCLAIVFSLRWPLTIPVVPRVVSHFAAHVAGLAGLVVSRFPLRLARALLPRALVASFGFAARWYQRIHLALKWSPRD